MNNIGKNQNGQVLIFTVFILSTISLYVFLTLTRSSLFALVDIDTEQNALITRSHLFGCLDEALIQIQFDSSFTATEISIPPVTCTASIQTPQGGQRTVYLSLTEGSITRSLRADMTVDPVIVTQIKETF